MLYARIKPDRGLETSFVREDEELCDFTKGMKPLNQSAEAPAVTGFQRIEARYEANLLDRPLTYDPALLHLERQQIRDRINELEQF